MSEIYDTPAFKSMMEASARTARVERVMALLTRPTYVWRMAKGKNRGSGPRGRGARTTYFNITKEIDEILRKEYGGA